MWPAVRIAARSLSEMLMTFEGPLPAIFSSSPTVLTIKRTGEAPSPLGAPRSFVLGSKMLATERPDSRSYQLLFTMPLREGVAPVRMVECPTAVTAGKCCKYALVKTAPLFHRVLKPPVYWLRNRVR